MPHSDELDAGNVLAVENLNIAFMQDQQKIAAVRNLSFSLQRGETLAIVGESGSGKSVTALALMRLLEQAGGLVQCDKMLLRRRSREVIELSEQSAAQMRHVRGADMAMIFQEPMTSLNPVFTVGEQIAESIRLHQNASREEAMVGTHSGGTNHSFTLSASTLWRDAPASDDCDGAVMPPGGADCR